MHTKEKAAVRGPLNSRHRELIEAYQHAWRSDYVSAWWATSVEACKVPPVKQKRTVKPPAAAPEEW